MSTEQLGRERVVVVTSLAAHPIDALVKLHTSRYLVAVFSRSLTTKQRRQAFLDAVDILRILTNKAVERDESFEIQMKRRRSSFRRALEHGTHHDVEAQDRFVGIVY